MKKIAMLTATFPHGDGEQFIESEVKYWSNSSEFELTIFPSLSKNENSRNVPNSIYINNALTVKKSIFSKLRAICKALFSIVFLKEIGYLIRENKLQFTALKQALIELAAANHFADVLEPHFKKNNTKIIYSYWNNPQSYGAILLKRRGVVDKVVSRCHGYDVYVDRRELEYMPLKWQFINEFNTLFVICSSQINYFQEYYNASKNQISLSRLGVEIPKNSSLTSPNNFLHILSVSYCVAVKRIDFIIEVLAVFYKLNPSINIRWTHIGDGLLKTKLEEHAQNKLKGINYSFLGQLSNVEVQEYYQNNCVDLFINTSESEGVPVSIMEAMSYGVPVIAPDVGGVSELLCPESCYLVKDINVLRGFINGVSELHINCKLTINRRLCMNKINKTYNREKNYSQFIRIVSD